jgi:hypothetical protein
MLLGEENRVTDAGVVELKKPSKLYLFKSK